MLAKWLTQFLIGACKGVARPGVLLDAEVRELLCEALLDIPGHHFTPTGVSQ